MEKASSRVERPWQRIIALRQRLKTSLRNKSRRLSSISSVEAKSTVDEKRNSSEPEKCLAVQLLDLPHELLLLILDRVDDPHDLDQLRWTSRALSEASKTRGLWISQAEKLSLRRPLALPLFHSIFDLPQVDTNDIRNSVLRAAYLEAKWAQPVIRMRDPRAQRMKKLTLAGDRAITYFAIIPGGRYILVFLSGGILACWDAITERCIIQYDAGHDAQITRWKPTDSADTVEILLEHSPVRFGAPPHFTLLRLTLNPPSLERLYSFHLPANVLPLSALTQEEMNGMLILLPESHTIGIFITDRNTGSRVTINTGIRYQAMPLALVSNDHIVLYWDTAREAVTHTYDTSTLRRMLASVKPTNKKHRTFQRVNDDPPPPVLFCPPDTSHNLRFSPRRPKLYNHTSFFPIIIPLSPTTTTDPNRHRVRSVLTLARHPDPFATPGTPQAPFGFGADPFQGALNGVNGALNALPQLNMLVQQLNGQMNGGPGAQNGQDIVQLAQNLMQLQLDPQAEDMPPPIVVPPGQPVLPPPIHEMEEWVEGEVPPDPADDPYHGIQGFEPHMVGFNENGDVMVELQPALQDPPDPPPAPPPPPVSPLFRPRARVTITHHLYDHLDPVDKIKRRVVADVYLRAPPTSDFVEDLPVIGYGGRTALWLEEILPEGGTVTAPVLRLASLGEKTRVSSLEVPEELGLDLYEACCFDLDDAVGLVGVATTQNELWLLNFA